MQQHPKRLRTCLLNRAVVEDGEGVDSSVVVGTQDVGQVVSMVLDEAVGVWVRLRQVEMFSLVISAVEWGTERVCAPHVAVVDDAWGEVDTVAKHGGRPGSRGHGRQTWNAGMAVGTGHAEGGVPQNTPLNCRETSEAPDWPVQWTDGAYTPEPSKPIWRGSMSEDLEGRAHRNVGHAGKGISPICLRFCRSERD